MEAEATAAEGEEVEEEVTQMVVVVEEEAVGATVQLDLLAAPVDRQVLRN